MKSLNQYTTKELLEGMTFTSFLIAEAAPELDTSTVRGYIRSLPQYQELIRDNQYRSDAIGLAKQLVDEFGDQRIGPTEQNYIFDRIDDMSSNSYKAGGQIGDWAGEEEYIKKQQKEQELEAAAARWEQEMGTDAQTGKKIRRKRRNSGARTGMDYTPDKKANQAKADLASFANDSHENQVDRIAIAKNRKLEGQPSKTAMAREIFNTNFGEKRPSEIITQMMNEVGMSKPHATTYYYKFKRAAR